jgi:hypothetical protein|tara:strand:- start:684 stop:860 length:177 start_codon:yes stop_codon:yes gene_type:complete
MEEVNETGSKTTCQNKVYDAIEDILGLKIEDNTFDDTENHGRDIWIKFLRRRPEDDYE